MAVQFTDSISQSGSAPRVWWQFQTSQFVSGTQITGLSNTFFPHCISKLSDLFWSSDSDVFVVMLTVDWLLDNLLHINKLTAPQKDPRLWRVLLVKWEISRSILLRSMRFSYQQKAKYTHTNTRTNLSSTYATTYNLIVMVLYSTCI